MRHLRHVRFCSIILMVCLLSMMTPCTAAAASAEDELWTGTIRYNEAIITGYTGIEKDLVIPDTFQGCPVKKIENYAFKDRGLTSVKLPETLRLIGNYAFAGNNFVTVSIPINVLIIGSNAFNENESLRTIYLEDRTDMTNLQTLEGWSYNADVVFGRAPESLQKSCEVSVTGLIEPVTALDIDVPVKTGFVIDEARNFISSDMKILNHSSVPVDVSAVSIKAKNCSTKVVPYDLYNADQWDNLTAAQTKSQIALGLRIQGNKNDLIGNPGSSTYWFGSEDKDSNLKIGTIKSAYNTTEPPAMTLGFDAMYGKAWGTTTDLEYSLILSFSAG